MPCTGVTETINKTSELEFVQSLVTRDDTLEACKGPLLRLAFSPWRTLTLETAFDSPVATDLLWDGHHLDGILGVHFTLCAAHWIDLCALVWMRSRQQRRSDWHGEADQLLRDVCDTAGWDPKEIVNMFSWQHSQLT